MKKFKSSNLKSQIFNTSKGFTLVELAIVLVVIGLLIGLGASLIGPLTKRAKFAETRETVKTAKEAVLGFAVKNGYLPADLEIAGAKRLDAWGRDISFYRASELTSGNACGVNSTLMQVYECTVGNCSTYNIKSNIAFIVYSSGEDANGAGTGTSSPFYHRIQGAQYSDAGRNYEYDDVVMYVSLDEIRSLSGCSQQLAIITPATLLEGEEDSFYSYSMQAIGGKPPYTWSGSAGSGLTLNPAGLLSGTINVNPASSTGELTACSAAVSISASVNDSAGSPAVNYTGSVPVRPRPLRIITEAIPSAYTGSPYTATISAKGGRTPYSWSMSVSPSCPGGLTCSGNSISGTPGTASQGTYIVTSTVNDTCTSNTRSFVLTIHPSTGGGTAFTASPAPGALPNATVGSPYNQSISLSGGIPPYTNTACTPASCNGLNLSCTVSGATISGTPTGAGTCNFNITWRDSSSPFQTAGGAYTVNISSPPMPPTCTLSATPGTVRYNETATLNWTITNGPANGSFSPPSGTCTTFSNSTGGSCTTTNLTAAGANTFTLTVSNASGSNVCNTTVIVGCQDYRVWNSTGAAQDFTIDATCRNSVANNGEITQPGNNRYLNVGESIIRHSSTAGTCTSTTAQTLTYDNAMNADTNRNCQVNFILTGTGAQDR